MSEEIFDGVAAYYDLVYQDKNYRKETIYIDSLIKTHSPSAKSIIDIGCGTGAHDWVFSDLGYEVIGIDQSPSMLELARQRSREYLHITETPIFELGSLKNFQVSSPSDVVVSLFDVISYVTDYDAFKSMCESLVLSLKPGGLLIFDCWYGPAVYSQGPSLSLKRLENDKISLVRIADGQLNPKNNSINVGYDIFITNKENSVVEHIQETHLLRCYFEDELDNLLGGYGFERLASQVWFGVDKPSLSSWSTLHVFRLKE